MPAARKTAPDARAASIEAGRRVLRTEGEALLAYAGALDTSFADAVDAILAVEGRVIISGMGKSGHVARKIASTLASTGTPAQFVHPAEASHGDLGMLTRADLALVLSNSGETTELADVIAHTRRFSIPLIGVASRPGSTLLNAADIALTLPDAPEACPVGLAPTTSTTAALALGDALAVALMKRRAFTIESFRMFHPGGKLGARLLTVEALMHSGAETPLVRADTPMTEALLEITSKGFGVAGVTDDAGRLIGVITDGDLRRKMDGLLSRTAAEVMTTPPRAISPAALAQEALAMLNAHKITCLFAVDPGGAGEAAGIVHIHDCLRAGVV